MGVFHCVRLHKHLNYLLHHEYNLNKLINGIFVVDSKILNEPSSSELSIDDKFIEINSIKSSDFKSYCDFLVFKDRIAKYEVLELKTIDNNTIRVKNWRN